MRTAGWAATALVGCLAACATSAGEDQVSAPRPHGSWVLTKIVDNGRPTAVPASADVYLMFTKQRPQVRGFDGCGWYSGSLHPIAGGAMKGEFAVTTNGCGSRGKTLDAVGRDLDEAFYRNRPVKIATSGKTLTITTATGNTLSYTAAQCVAGRLHPPTRTHCQPV
jgi:hypothetical protein